MAGVAAKQRAADRLRHVANQDAGPAIEPCHVGSELVDIGDEHGMAPKAIAGKPHSLPTGAVRG